jgi:DNA-binding beta-propeller fold protein YncE
MGVLGSEQVTDARDGSGLAERSVGARARPAAFRGRVGCALLAAAISACSWLALSNSTALALSQRGHAFSGSFSCPLAGASGMAVDEASGVLYVADRGANRVEMFAPAKSGSECVIKEFASGTAPEAIAVDNSEEAGDPSKGDVYVVGRMVVSPRKTRPVVFKYDANGNLITTIERAGLRVVKGVAVDPSGTLFVSGESGPPEELTPMIEKFNNASVNQRHGRIELELTGLVTGAFAVDAEDNFYVGHVNGAGAAVVAKLDKEGKLAIGQLDSESTAAVATSLKDANEVKANDAYLLNVTSVAAFDSSGSLIQRFTAEGATQLKGGSALAVDSKAGAVYVTDSATNNVDVFGLEAPGPPRVDSLSALPLPPPEGATNAIELKALVDPSGAPTSAHFEYGLASCATITCKETEEVPAGGGFGHHEINAKLPPLEPGLYHFRVVATNTNVHGTVTSLEQTFAIVWSAVGLPDGRAWEMVSPPNKGGFEPEPIFEAMIQAATDGSAITYPASGPIPADGTPEGNRIPEPTQIISHRGETRWETQDIATPHTAGSGIAEGIPWEYQAFSPNLSLAAVQPFTGIGGTGPLAEPPLSPPEKFKVGGEEVTEGCAPASPANSGEYEDKDCTKKVAQSKTGKYEKIGQEKTIYLRADAPLLPGEKERENYEAALQNGAVKKNVGYLAVVTEANALGVLGGSKQGEAQFAGPFEAGIALMNATPDLSHGLIKSYRANPGLYEWGPNKDATLKPNPKLQLVSVLPENFPATGGSFYFGAEPNMRHAISDDGARVFWTRESGSEFNLFVRDTERNETLWLDRPTTGSGANTPAATFVTASADGRRVFFTDTQRLTADSKATPGSPPKPDLYVYELSPPGQALSGTLTDLTPGTEIGESVAVQGFTGVGPGSGGGVLGAGNDGSYVYFVANGALTPGATPGSCNINLKEPAHGRACNLYVRHFHGGTWEAPKLIGMLSNEDGPDWGVSGAPGNLSFMTSRVSPNGRYVTFMSDRSLTGYNNEDAKSKAPDEEVFLYDAGTEAPGTESLVCASCNPTGARPEGVFDLGSGTGEAPPPESEGVGLLVDRLSIWGSAETKVAHWLAGSVPGGTPVGLKRSIYQSHYLSDEGRLFFNSPDHLVPAATGVKEKVYEYEPNGVGGCRSESGCIGLLSAPNNAGEKERERESAFLDASEKGNDVFFLTAAKLSLGDVDRNYDIYDARVCGQDSTGCLSPPPPGSLGCKGEVECKGEGRGGSGFTAPASQRVSSSGNVPSLQVRGSKEEGGKPKPGLTRAQLLAKALKACRTKYKAKSKHKQRASCEARARKKYAHSSKHQR